MTLRKVFSFDAETDGLWGDVFAIGAIVLDENGVEIARFIGRLPDSMVTDKWVRKIVLPELACVPVTRTSYQNLLADFRHFYLENKDGADVVVHMGYIVEAHLLREMHRLGLIDDRGAPFPLLDVSGNLQQAGENPLSVDDYVRKHGLSVGEFDGGTHNPLYDSAAAAVVYRHLMANK